jgi:hypothetical protein
MTTRLHVKTLWINSGARGHYDQATLLKEAAMRHNLIKKYDLNLRGLILGRATSLKEAALNSNRFMANIMQLNFPPNLGKTFSGKGSVKLSNHRDKIPVCTSSCGR